MNRSTGWYPTEYALVQIGKKALSLDSHGLVAVEYINGSWVTNLTFVFMFGKIVVRSPPD